MKKYIKLRIVVFTKVKFSEILKQCRDDCTADVIVIRFGLQGFTVATYDWKTEATVRVYMSVYSTSSLYTVLYSVHHTIIIVFTKYKKLVRLFKQNLAKNI